jgi:hypothetical protein
VDNSDFSSNIANFWPATKQYSNSQTYECPAFAIKAAIYRNTSIFFYRNCSSCGRPRELLAPTDDECKRNASLGFTSIQHLCKRPFEKRLAQKNDIQLWENQWQEFMQPLQSLVINMDGYMSLSSILD